jgi:hypothetical protein
LLGKRTYDRESRVEGAADGDDARAMSDCLRKLPGGDLARRQDDRAAQTSASGVGGGGRGGVPGRGAEHHPCSGFESFGDGHDHPAVFERAGRILPFDFQPDLGDARLAFQGASADERGPAFAEGKPGCSIRYR